MTNNNSTDMAIGSERIGFAGNLSIKACLNNTFKKTTINNDELTYDELVLMLQRLFNGKFDAKDDVKLKYRDEDGDLIEIENDYDLKSAIQSNRYLKLVISLGEDEDNVSFLDDKAGLSEEIRKLRKLLKKTVQDILEIQKKNESVKPQISNNSSFDQLNNGAPVHLGLNNLNLYDSKEFDTLVNKTDDLKSEKSTIVQEEESIKSLNSGSLKTNSNQEPANNERQPATLQPSAQQFQSTQNLQSKILNQSQQQYPPMLPNQQTMMPGSNQQNQIQQQMPYRYGIPPSNATSNVNQSLNSRPNTFNPNEMPSGSHPPSSYPTPSSTPANTYGMNQQLMNQPPQLTSPPGPPQLPSYPPPISGPPSLSGPPTSMNTTSAFTQSNRSVGPPPTGLVGGLQQANRPINQGPPPNGIVPPSSTNAPLPQSNLQGPPQSNLQGPQQSNLQGPPQSNLQSPPQSNIQGPPPQFSNFMPPTGPYPGQQAPKGNPFSRNGPQARYAYPQQQQFN